MKALEVLAIFLRLGLTSFGGPIAHLGYFRREFVEKRAWLDEAAYGELVALCQFLPGPASSQVGFAIGLQRAGWLGGLAAFIGFTTPSALLMLAVAAGADGFATPIGAALAHGLKLVAVVVVAHAVVAMAKALCDTRAKAALAFAVFAALLAFAAPLLLPLLILGAGVIGALALAPAQEGPAMPWNWSLVAIAGAVLAVAAALVWAAAAIDHPLLQLAAAMAKSGALVFGGGHVALPLLEAETVGRGWLSADRFLAGYGAAQALPGPLFSLAAFIGAEHLGLIGGLTALIAVFLPGLMLVALLLPFWRRIQVLPWAMGFIAGAHAAVVGVLGAAFYDPVFISAVRDGGDLAIAAIGYGALTLSRTPLWLIVLGVAAAGGANAYFI